MLSDNGVMANLYTFEFGSYDMARGFDYTANITKAPLEVSATLPCTPEAVRAQLGTQNGKQHWVVK